MGSGKQKSRIRGKYGLFQAKGKFCCCFWGEGGDRWKSFYSMTET